MGFYHISIKELLMLLLYGEEAVTGENSSVFIIIKNIRMPRIIAAFTIGAGLSMAGSLSRHV